MSNPAFERRDISGPTVQGQRGEATVKVGRIALDGRRMEVTVLYAGAVFYVTCPADAQPNDVLAAVQQEVAAQDEADELASLVGLEVPE